MNATIILTVTFFILVCTIPIVIIVWNNKKNERALLEKLLGFATRNHDRVTRHDLLDNMAIGLSEASNTLFFIKDDHNNTITEVVHLSEIAKCSLNKAVRRSLDGESSTIERIELIFTYKQNQNPAGKIEFYDLEHQGMALHGELQLAEKWLAIIVDRLKPVLVTDNIK